jgi:hypothetical protein
MTKKLGRPSQSGSPTRGAPRVNRTVLLRQPRVHGADRQFLASGWARRRRRLLWTKTGRERASARGRERESERRRLAWLLQVHQQRFDPSTRVATCPRQWNGEKVSDGGEQAGCLLSGTVADCFSIFSSLFLLIPRENLSNFHTKDCRTSWD